MSLSVSWYPVDPSENVTDNSIIPIKVQGNNEEQVRQTIWNNRNDKCKPLITDVNKNFSEKVNKLNKLLTYTTSNKWQSIPKDKIESSKRHQISGVEVRKLGNEHILKGEYGLFATQQFFKFDVLGEYTGFDYKDTMTN